MEIHQVDELEKLRHKAKPEWANQIRSYFIHPYQLVKDHRNNVETNKVNDVLNGNIDCFVESLVGDSNSLGNKHNMLQ